MGSYYTGSYYSYIISDSGKFGNGHYGLEKSLGHADFYPSNGRDQPFCRANTFYKQVRKMERMIYTNFYRTIKGHEEENIYFNRILKVLEKAS